MSDATTIEALQIEVQSSSASAASGVDALTASLDKLKSATKGGAGLTAVVKQLSALSTALNGISGTNVDSLNKLTQSLQTLSACGNIKLSSSIATQINSIGAATMSLSGVDYSVLTTLAQAITPLASLGKINLGNFASQLTQLPAAIQALGASDMGLLSMQLKDLVTALAPLSSLGKNNLTSFITQLSKIPKLMTALQGVDMRTLYNQIQSLTRVFAPLAVQMQAIANGFAAFPTRIQKLITSTNKLSTSNSRASSSYMALAAKIGGVYAIVSRVARGISSVITETNRYIENMNLFSVSMGKFTNEAQEYAEKVGEIMGINPGEFMRNQGIFMTLTKGFGVAGDRAQLMSKNLTQLGYDLTSFYNLEGGVAEGMQKLQSGIAGELEPLRRLGYDLSVARLQQEAYNLGITKSVSAMNQAEKAELRYYTIMKQVSWVQGDMARTLESPSNQLRILKAQLEQCAIAWGNVLLPALKAVLPYASALVRAFRSLAEAIAVAFNITLPEFDGSGIDDAASGSEDIAEGLTDANEQAKALKNALLGMDELNVISPTNDSSESIADIIGDSSAIDLPDYGSFLSDAFNEQADDMIEKTSEILASVLAVGQAFLTWVVPKALPKVLAWLTALKSSDFLFRLVFRTVGLTLFLDAWNTMKEAIEDIQKNDASFANVTKLISGFAEGLAASLLLFGNIKFGGPMLILSGITGFIAAIGDLVENGVSFDGVLTLLKNIGLVITGIGTLGNKPVNTGVGLIFTGLTLVLQNVSELINGFKTNDFSNVDWVETAIGALMIISGLLVAIKKFDVFGGFASLLGKTQSAAGTAAQAATATGEKVKNTFDTAGKTAQGVGDSVGKLSTKLTSLAKNLAMGLVIIVEVAAAALIIVGAIILLGKELEQVCIAWKPVLENGGTVAIAMALGVGILVAIGAVTAILGSVGTSLIVNIALGLVMLVELGVAAGLFLLEIWAIGKALDEIRIAWEPVLSNGETIALAIGIGTAILLGIGVVCALLGVAAVASVGMLPLAIALGTLMLLELGVAALLFIAEIRAIGKGLDEMRVAWEPIVNKGEEIANCIVVGTKLLVAIGAVVAVLGTITLMSGMLLPIAIGLGTALLLAVGIAVVAFVKSITSVANVLTYDLYPALNGLNAIGPELLSDMGDFNTFFVDFAKVSLEYSKNSTVTGIAATIGKIIGFFVADPVQSLSDGVCEQYKQTSDLVASLKQAIPKLKEATSLLTEYKKEVALLQLENGKTNTGSLITVGISLVTEGWDGAKRVINSVIGGVETLVNSVIKGINTMITALNRISFDIPDWVPAIGGKQFGFNIQPVPFITIPQLASGGVVESGQMFIAREAGAELVGNVGGRTSVMNNDQIVESVSKGVYDAVVSAMMASSSKTAGGNGEVVVKVYLDSKEITASVEKRQRERGVDILGGVVYG